MKLLSSLLRVATIFSITFCVLSCGKDKKPPITFNVRGGKSVALVPTSSTTCKEEVTKASTTSLSSRYAVFTFPEINIDKARILELYEGLDLTANRLSFNIIGITVKIDSDNISGGKFRCLISGEELGYLYYVSGGATKWTPNAITYDATTAQFKGTDYYTSQGYSSCPIKCGGISTKDGVFTMPVTFELIIISSLINPDGTQTDVPYKLTTTGSVQQLF